MSSKPLATDRRLKAPWLQSPSVRQVFSLFEPGQLRLVGGCVRDGLLGIAAADIDFATPLAPQAIMDIASRSNVKSIPTGVEHGTVTLLVDDMHFEVTTLREDVETDGRHAVVAFTEQWEIDAARRDFTVNALYADGDGQIFDYFGGLDDLNAGLIRFIGSPNKRIREDALRILRFYRFSAGYCDTLDQDGRAACAELSAMVRSLSRERVAKEWLRLLSYRAPETSLFAMAEDGVLTAFLPEAETGQFSRVRALEDIASLPPDPLRRCACLLPDDAKVAENVARRLKLSNVQRRRLISLTQRAPETTKLDILLYEKGPQGALDTAALSLWSDERMKALATFAKDWVAPTFPISGGDLLENTSLKGSAIGRALFKLESSWKQSGFTLSKSTLIDQAKRMVEDKKG